MKSSFNLSHVLSRVERLVPRRLPQRTVVAQVVYVALLFVVFLFWTLPVDVIAERLVNRVSADWGLRLAFGGVRLLPWDGFSFLDVRVERPPGTPWADLSTISLRPSLKTFLGQGFRNGVFKGEAYGGTFAGTADWSKPLSLDFAWSDLDLAEYSRLKTMLDGTWQGKLSGEVHLRDQNGVEGLAGGGKISLAAAAILGGNVSGFKIPDLHFSRGEGDFELKDGRLDIRRLQMSGSEIDLDCRGQIFLRRPVADSVANATLGLRPLPGGGRDIENAVRLLGGNRPPQNGTYTFSLSGTLRSLAIH